MKRLYQLLSQQWFLALLLTTVALGIAYPAPGKALSKAVGPKPFIFLLLFLPSIMIKSSELWGSLRSFKAILLGLFGTYVVMPALFCLAIRPLGLDTPEGVGLVVMGASPTTLASAAVWTRLAGGNTALCVVMTVVSNALNFLLGPMVLKATLGASHDIALGDVVLELAKYVLLPIVLGQIVARVAGPRRATWDKPISIGSRLLLILVVVQAASEASERAHDFSMARLGLLASLCVAAHGLAALAMEIGGRALKLDLKDRVAAVYVGSQKTLPVSLKLLQLFPGNELGVISVVMYHALQLIFDTFLIEVFQRRLRAQEKSAAPMETVPVAQNAGDAGA
ncbi:MAG: bile acid:sodium symporter [Planctomycetes bacterium]|nr:bile acid:sodium symporter [Planctomycetota bacterium]